VDASGNVFVVDGNGSGRKITPEGVVTTTTVRADSVAVDGIGNVYVSDGRYTISKITPTGSPTTLAGTDGVKGSTDGTGAQASFTDPSGIAADGVGNVYVADTGNHTIRKIAPNGVVTTLAGTAAVRGMNDGIGAAAGFGLPSALAVDGAGNVYASDLWNLTIRKISAAGVVTTLAGIAGTAGKSDGVGTAASFYMPLGVVVDETGNVYVADGFRGCFFVCPKFANTIRKISPTGVVTTFAGTAGSWDSADGVGTAASFSRLDSLAVDASGNIFVVDGSAVRKITPSGVVTTLARGFVSPRGVAVDGAGNIYLADGGDATIRRITPEGTVTTLAGTVGVSGTADGIGAAALFNYPSGVAVDKAANVYVVDGEVIRKITQAGVVTTVAGTRGSIGAMLGSLPGSLSHSYIGSIAAGAEGMLYVTTDAGVLKIQLPQ
jgi:sugar lactone lactonase YvrE